MILHVAESHNIQSTLPSTFNKYIQIEPVQPAQNRKYNLAAVAAVLILASFGLYSSLNDRIFDIGDYGGVQKVRPVISLPHASVIIVCILSAFHFS